MKFSILFLMFISNYCFSQLDENKKTIDSRLISTEISPQYFGEYREEIKLANKSFDTIKILFNKQDIAKQFSVYNIKSGISDNHFHLLSTHINIGFKLTNSINIDNQSFYYDSTLKRLIIKKFSTEIKNKLIEVKFISDYNLILKELPEIKNWN